MSTPKPIMIHSLFRAGSTYIFNVFRRSNAGYWCYQEPLHEVFADHSPEAQWREQTTGESRTSELRHPSLDRPYFWEFAQCADFVESHYKKEFAFETFFLGRNDDGQSDLRSYIEGLSERAAGQPVFQFCRSMGRMAWFRQQFDAIHLHLWRNPWDQWWSYKINNYFDNTLAQIFSAENMPKVLIDIFDKIKIKTSQDVDNNFDTGRIFNRIPLIVDPERSYLLFYALWAWGLLESRFLANEQINIDSLSTSAEYRRKMEQRLGDFGVAGLDFGDANVPQMSFGDSDREFFLQIEDVVHKHMLAGGFQESDLEWLKQQRALHAPIGTKSTFNSVGSVLDLYRRIGGIAKNLILSAQHSAQVTEQQCVDLKAELTAQLAYIEKNLVSEQHRAQVAEQKISELKAQLAEAHSREYEFLNSASWRITAPLRRLREVGNRFGRAGRASDFSKESKNRSELASGQVNPSALPSKNSSARSLSTAERNKLFLEWLERSTLTQYDRDHKVRFWETYLRLDGYLATCSRLLELGGESRITNYLKAQLGMDVEVYGQDLRYPFELSSSSFDMVLCLEVIEHIKDRTETGGISEIAMFNRSGVRNVFAESRRVLKEGGILFMTTPNACCIDSIARIFLYQAPQLYAPHVKEFAAAELIDLAKEFNFELIAYSTANVWNPLPPIDREQINSILREANIPTEDRGDDMFLVFQKR